MKNSMRLLLDKLSSLAYDDFDDETFYEDDGNGDGMDNISQGLEDDEIDVASMDEDDFTLGASTLDDVLKNT